MAKRFRASIYGGSGFAGAELIRRLLIHPEVELARVCSIDHVGEPLASAHPHLEGVTELTFEKLPPAQAAADVDVVLLGLPHQASIGVVEALLDTSVKVIDMSGAFRVKDLAAYAKYYGGAHPRPDLVERFVYGLPELNRAEIRSSRFVASPGCFATTIELALLPLARAGLLEGTVEVVGITGSSGAGVTPTATTHHPVRAQNLRTYKPLEHQHVPEIEGALSAVSGRPVSIAFVPVSAPLSRGIFVTAFARVSTSHGEASLKALFTEAYAREPFVRVPSRRLPEVVAVSGSCFAEVGLTLGPPEGATRLLTVFGALDNLVKGGAGQAIQSMNLMLGLDERLSLEDVGGYP
ncbi:MAG TPA: N-acetyl-gamma-glutamyl-phosphate reductase [Polyangiaceae bacterium]|nr:N-acetyl-gamma-glutamyl-phosphate reductase [Polyangiaceae bacterium]